MKENKLQLHAMEVRREALKEHKIYIYRMPSHLKDFLGKVKPIKEYDWTGTVIKKVVILNFPGVLFAFGKVYQISGNDNIWFVSMEEINVELLKIRTIEWIKKSYEDNFNEKFPYDLDGDWGKCECVSMDTLYRYEALMYGLLPKYYGYRLTQKPIRMDTLGCELNFTLVMTDGTDTELITSPIFLGRKNQEAFISENIEEIVTDEETYYTDQPFSYYLDIRLKKCIDEEYYTLHTTLHTRIWTGYSIINKNTGKNYLSGKQSTKVYLCRDSKYYNHVQPVYFEIDVKRGKKEKAWWCDCADSCFLELEQIDIQEILEQNQAVRNFEMNGHALIITKFLKNYVSRGAGLPERKEMWERITECFPELTPRQPLNEIHIIGKTILTTAKEVEDEEGISEELQFPNIAINKKGYLYNGNCNRIIFYVASNNPVIQSAFQEMLQSLLRVSFSNHNIVQINGKEVQIVFVKNQFSGMLPCINRKTHEKEREEELRKIFGDDKRNTLKLAAIDMLDFRLKKYSNLKDIDPKYFIRNKLAKMGVMTQFIDGSVVDGMEKETVYRNKDFLSRLKNTVEDLVFAGGFYSPLMYEDKKYFIHEMDCIVGFGRISDLNNGKIFGMTLIKDGAMFIRLYNDEERWFSIPEMCQRLDRELLKKVNFIGCKASVLADGIKQWFLRTINELTCIHKKVVCFIDCASRNQLKLAKNADFKKCMETELFIHKENLTLIRFNTTDEVPSAHTLDDKKPYNRISGVYQSEYRRNTFYLVHKRSDIKAPKDSLTKLMLPSKPLYLQTVAEIDIVTSQETLFSYYAELTFDLMSMPLTASPQTLTPLPLYLLKRLTEYIIAENGKDMTRQELEENEATQERRSYNKREFMGKIKRRF